MIEDKIKKNKFEYIQCIYNVFIQLHVLYKFLNK